MALLDLSTVSDALVRLLTLQLPEYGVLPLGVIPNVSAAPPDLVKGDYGLSLYLYHLCETAHTKGQDWGTDDGVPQRYKPMGVSLFYVLCARSTMADVDGRTATDQQLMGLAVKTLHDYPMLTDASVVETGAGPQVVFQGTLLGSDNKLCIHLQPIPYNEAPQYWQAGSQPLRLAAYYEVTATLLEPQVLKKRASRVLTVGVHAFARGTPRINSSNNTVQFTVPGDPIPRSVTCSPAEVTYGDRFDLRGSDLKGDRTVLILSTQRFAAPIELDPTAWKLRTDGTTLSAEVQTTAGATAIFPGLYTVTVKAVARKRLPDGRSRDFDWYSNVAAISIVPRISAIGVAAGLFTLTVPDFDLTLVNAATEIQFFVGADKLANVGGAPTPGEFRVLSSTQLQFRCPPGAVTGEFLPLRLMVLGAENAPLWVKVP